MNQQIGQQKKKIASEVDILIHVLFDQFSKDEFSIDGPDIIDSIIHD